MRVSGIGALVLAAVARALDTCDCIPGFHEAKDTTCRIDALGRIRVLLA